MSTEKRQKSEIGQVLVLSTLMMSALILAIMVVVDVGFYLQERQNVQKAADAAALAGAQELPDDPSAAQVVALDYALKNGIPNNKVTISFKCTSDSQPICKPGDGRYDTIVVTPTATAKNFFGGILKVVGVNNCWVGGCNVTASAAGCRGACGPIGGGPAEVMVALDHSYSMSTANITNAKDAALNMFQNFDNTYQRVGVAVTPPVMPNNHCDTVDYWSDPLTWIPAPLTYTFQSSPHVLNNGSEPVTDLNCLDRADWPGGELSNEGLPGHTNLGDPIKAATAELAANGRADVTWGIILLTDGAANVAPPLTLYSSTGPKYCTTQAAVTSNAGDNNGFQTNASLGCANGGGVAADANSGTNTNTTCTNTGKDKHNFWGFGANSGIPAGASINGIEVKLDAFVNSNSGTRSMCVELSWNNGTNWTSAQSFNFPGSNASTEATYTLGSSTDTWGHAWTIAELGNLRVRVTNVADSTSRTFSLDAANVNVYYSYANPNANHKGPCDYAAQQATAAKALGIEIFTIAWGATDKCDSSNGELSTSPYYNMTAANFLKALATDDSHFYNEPKSSDLEPIFYAIGSALTAGSRLIE